MRPKSASIKSYRQGGCRIPSLIVATFLLCASCSGIVGVLAQSDVRIFAPGVIPTDAHAAAPAFTPDGNTVYLFESSGASDTTIMFSERQANKWSVPKVAPFSGKYRDLEPVFAPDGKYLIFSSNRPKAQNGALLDGDYNGQVIPQGGGSLWRVDLVGKEWEQPRLLPPAINSSTSVFSPAITADGSLYFMRAENGGKFHIYRAGMKNGMFETPVLASFSDAASGEYDPAVASDESYLVFSSPRAPAPPHTTDLFIVFREGSGWGNPIDLRGALTGNVHGVEARLSPDGLTLYFTNSHSPSGADVPNTRYIWSVDLSTLLKTQGIVPGQR